MRKSIQLVLLGIGMLICIVLIYLEVSLEHKHRQCFLQCKANFREVVDGRYDTFVTFENPRCLCYMREATKPIPWRERK